jgi:hypothetical protein
MLIGPTATTGVQPIASMGNDTPLAVLSDKPKHLYNTSSRSSPRSPTRRSTASAKNSSPPPRPSSVPRAICWSPARKSCRMIRLDSPLLDNKQLAKLREAEPPGFKSATLDALFPSIRAAKVWKKPSTRSVPRPIRRSRTAQPPHHFRPQHRRRIHAAMPTLLVMGGLHHHLVRSGTRTRVSIILETGEAREVHHFSTLIGYGADAINPYMAFDSIAQDDRGRDDRRSTLTRRFTTSSRAPSRAWSKPWPRWGSPPWPPTAAPRFSKPSAWHRAREQVLQRHLLPLRRFRHR